MTAIHTSSIREDEARVAEVEMRLLAPLVNGEIVRRILQLERCAYLVVVGVCEFAVQNSAGNDVVINKEISHFVRCNGRVCDIALDEVVRIVLDEAARILKQVRL